MRTDILAKRDAIATERIGDAMADISERHGVGAAAVSAFQSAAHRDRAITAMRRNEAVADFLDALNGAPIKTGANTAAGGLLERLTAIQGIGDAKAKQIIAAIEGE